MSSKASELEQFVPFQLLGKLDGIIVIKSINGVAKSLVVLFLDEQRVVCVVDSFDVELEVRSVTGVQVWSQAYIDYVRVARP